MEPRWPPCQVLHPAFCIWYREQDRDECPMDRYKDRLSRGRGHEVILKPLTQPPTSTPTEFPASTPTFSASLPRGAIT